jgi:hypothetical protein
MVKLIDLMSYTISILSERRSGGVLGQKEAKAQSPMHTCPVNVKLSALREGVN